MISTPLELTKNTTIKNRFMKSAMSEQLADSDHNPGPGIDRLYRVWAKGGIGLSMTGNVMVDRKALGEPKNVVLDEHSDLGAFSRWAAAGTQQGTSLWMQLNHPGKQTPAFLSREPLAPSAVPLGKGLEKVFNTPREMTEAEILDVIEKFGVSAGLAKKTGFSGVQIHGAHGYLVSQFLSPHHNRREDQWGGSLENRARFVMSVYQSIRDHVGEEYPVGIKLNTADFMKGGFSMDDSAEVAMMLAQAGIDLLEISGGTYESPAMMSSHVKDSTIKREAYFLEAAGQIRSQVDVPLVVTGGFRSARAMTRAIENGETDMIGLARPLAVDPEFPEKLMADAGHTLQLVTPSTGVRAVDQMVMLGLTYYEYQLSRIAQGKAPVNGGGYWKSVFQTLGRMGRHAFTRRRA